MLKLATALGTRTLNLINMLADFSFFQLSVISSAFRPPIYFNIIYKHIISIGFYSLPVVALTTFFSGAVLALQTYTGFSRFSAESTIATVVVLSITREIGPSLTALMVAGRVGASIAAEIGTMKVTEQIDALYTLATNPIKYLFFPRVIAAVITLPCLVIIGDIIGVFGGYIVAVYKLGFNGNAYLINSLKYLEAMDVISGLVKAAVFGFIITIVSCYTGYTSEKGAKGVGNATTKAVVASSILILLSNYLITELFFKK